MALMAKKTNTPARFAYIGLIVAVVAIVATGLIGLFKGIIGLGLYTPQDPQPINIALSISAGLIIVGLAAFAIMDPNRVRRFLTGRQARYGSNALILALAVIGIIVVVNVLVYQNPQKLDLTENKIHTLAPETLQALATLPDKVQAVAFYSSRLPIDEADKLLLDLKTNSNGKFDYQFVDPDLNPVEARKAGITGDGKIMLMMGDHKEIASYASETELTRALIRLINPNERVIYFLTGHGEADINGGEMSLGTAKSTLESKNYTVRTLNLLTENKIPEDALTIVIPGPQKPLDKQEVSLLKKYVDAGGGLVVMENPTPFTEFGESADPLADYTAKDWGITLDKNVIIDVTSQQPLNAVSASYSQSHPITQNQSYYVIMPQARSLSLTSTPQDVTATSLIQTSSQSWGEVNFTSAENSQISYDEGVDMLGPLNMAIAADNSVTKGRIVVFGNSIFATDEGFDAYGNGNIFVNSIDWTAEQEDLINITPREAIERTFTPPSSFQSVMILLSSICIIPGLIIIAGISSWISRRKRG
jgi:ABC-type uncharacterized transport system involved in gliding motility auxiliary subunit